MAVLTRDLGLLLTLCWIGDGAAKINIQTLESFTRKSMDQHGITTACISGVSNSGKTYYSTKLLKPTLEKFYNFTVDMVHLDDFLVQPMDAQEHERYSIKFNRGGSKFERTVLYPALDEVSGYNFGLFWDSVREHDGIARKSLAQGHSGIENRKFLIVEGHKMLKAPIAFNLCDLVFEITVDVNVAMKRRRKRKDKEAYRLYPLMKTQEWFEQVTWPNHEHYKKVSAALANKVNKVIRTMDNKDIPRKSDLEKLRFFIVKTLLA